MISACANLCAWVHWGQEQVNKYATRGVRGEQGEASIEFGDGCGAAAAAVAGRPAACVRQQCRCRQFFWWVSVQDSMPIRARLQRVQKAQGPLLGRALHRWPTTRCDK